MSIYRFSRCSCRSPVVQRPHRVAVIGSGRLSTLPLLFLVMVAMLLPVGDVRADPSDFSSFGRVQKIDHQFNQRDLMRIWVVFVNQGDGILIQLPEKYNYDSNPNDSDPRRQERLEILIDGGTFEGREDQQRMLRFLQALYRRDPVIEYGVISHHDSDHVTGLRRIFDESDTVIQTLFHNGLASWRSGAKDFRDSTSASEAVISKRGGKLSRGMAFVDGDELDSSYLITSRAALSRAKRNNLLQGVYENLAEGILSRTGRDRVASFARARSGGSFIAEREARLDRGVDLSGLRFDVIWPRNRLRPYKSRNWGYTINGNSITFRLVYGEFEMLFTGDHNEESESDLLDRLGNDQSVLKCDVLKVPHHGSSHGTKDFFTAADPVVSVASMGAKGFQSKKQRPARRFRNAWQHPATNVIQWLGGSDRVFHTFIHEKKFDYDRITSAAKRRAMIEHTHILIETDGDWFRIVELDAPADPSDPQPGNLFNPPSVSATRRGDGTRWIRAH